MTEAKPRTWRPNIEGVQPMAEKDRFYGEFPIGTVLAFKKKFAGASSLYGYVALRAGNGRWYLTASAGRQAGSPMSWKMLVEFIGDNPCSIVTEWMDV